MPGRSNEEPSSTAETHAHYHGIVVSHTHWDRAWYLPFETFRHRLVRLVDRVMDLLEENDDYRAFTLDGQTVLLEDYLEVRPDQEPRLRDLIERGRLQIGPWYTLPDLFLVSGEAVIRNLQEGRRLCEDFGADMAVGYIPDPFGHFAQMPQILRGFDLDTYIFMRGLSAETKERLGAVFSWEAPDGSRVRAVYQRQGYFPAAALGHPEIYGRFDGHTPTVDLARERLEDSVDLMGPLQDGQTLLLSNGFDHMPEQPELPDLLDAVGTEMNNLTLTHGRLPEFVDALKAERAGRGTFRGDLIGNADHPILLNVYSARMYLKRQNHRAQQMLTRYAEPMSAWLDAVGIGPDARPLLRHAWKTLLRNHPHDDICGCSVDAVHDEDEIRFEKVQQVGGSLLTEHLESLLKSGGFEAPAETGDRASDVWVFNPHPRPGRYRVDATVFFPTPDGTREAIPPPRPLRACTGDGTEIDVTVRSTEGDVLRSNYLEATWGRRYAVTMDVELPALGYDLVHIFEAPDEGDASQRAEIGVNPGEAEAIGGTRPVLENGHYRVDVDGDRVHLIEKEGGPVFDDLLQFEYQLDAGDTYSFGPVPAHGPWWATLQDAGRHPTRPETLRLHHRLSVPEHFEREHGPAGETELAIQTDLSLNPHKGVTVRVRYDNTARDGRLRAVFPTGVSTGTALADGHFRLAEREKPERVRPEDAPERYEGYPGELTYPTQHQGDFVLVEGERHRTWIAQRGLPEYELLDPNGDTHVAVTLHRSVGWLSVEGGRIRRCQAGPTVPTPGAQCLREMGGDLSFGVGPVSREAAVRHARSFAHPAWTRELPHLPYVDGEERHPRRRSLLEIEGEGIELSAWKPGESVGASVLRLWNRTGERQQATVRFAEPIASAFESWMPVSLTEERESNEGRPFDGVLEVELSPHEIRTVLLGAG